MRKPTVPLSYSPALATTTWNEVQPFVEETIATRCAHMQRRWRDEHQRALAYFGDWVVQTRIGQLDDALRADVIDLYEQARAQEVLSTMAARERKMLLTVAGMPPRVERGRGSTASAPERPYTADELASFRDWAQLQRTPRRREECQLVLALGAGCGLTAQEMVDVRPEHLTEVHGVPGVRVMRDGRFVPVLMQWTTALAHHQSRFTNDHLLAPGVKNRRQALTEHLAATLGDNKPTPTRLRVTWLVTHLEAGTPIPALLPASGMTSIDSLRSALEHVRPLDESLAVAALREAEGRR